MIQFNLLPDVKLQYLRAKRTMRIIIAVCVVATSVSLVTFVLLFSFVKFGQPSHIKDLDKDIDKSVSTLKQIQDLDKVLTVQNQLNTLPGLHDNKRISSRLYTYLFQVTPQKATIAEVKLDIDAGTLSIKGNSDSFETVNKFVDTMKFTDYTTNKLKDNDTGKVSNETGKAFNNVVFSKFEVSRTVSTTGAGPVEYQITSSFDAKIFANIKNADPTKQAVELKVPSIITTRSVSESPAGLFVPQEKKNDPLVKPAPTQGGQ